MVNLTRVFTKLMEPVYATLRSARFISVAYIDDSLLISDTAEHCSKNVNETINLLSELGFAINYLKISINTGTFNKIPWFYYRLKYNDDSTHKRKTFKIERYGPVIIK